MLQKRYKYKDNILAISDPVDPVPDPYGQDIEVDQFAIIFTLSTFSLISCH